MYGVIVFFSTQEAMKAEMLAKGQGLKARIIPTPETLFASCGFSLKYEIEDEAALVKLFNEQQAGYDKFYHASREGLTVTYEEVKEK